MLGAERRLERLEKIATIILSIPFELLIRTYAALLFFYRFLPSNQQQLLTPFKHKKGIGNSKNKVEELELCGSQGEKEAVQA